MKFGLLTILWIGVLIFFQLHSCKEFTGRDAEHQNNEYAAIQTATKYVGAKQCAACHEDIYKNYLQTGMGKSFYLPARNNSIEDFSPSAVVFDKHSNYYYYPFWANNTFFILEFRLQNKDTVYKRTEIVNYIIGSGNQTRSYIINKNGYLYEAPITWYVEKKIWDLSPGYENGNNSRFERPIGNECMACHNGHFEFTPHSKNHYTQIPLGIDCESCHGAGSEHVKKMQQDDIVDVGRFIDYSIVNPKKLSWDKQFDICQNCHLQGTNVPVAQTNFVPSQSLNKVRQIFLPASQHEDAFGIASHAERLQKSKCFIASQKKLNCATCHNPHKSVHQTDPQVYNKACAKCHTSQTCTEQEAVRQVKNNDCALCHLPKSGTSDIPHVSFTDHYIRITDKNKPAKTPDLNAQKKYLELICATSTSPSAIEAGKAYLNYYEQNHAHGQYLQIASEKLQHSNCYFERSKIAYYQQDFETAEKLISNIATSKIPEIMFHHAEILEKLTQYQKAYHLFLEIYESHPVLVEAGSRAAAALIHAQPGKTETLLQAQKILAKVLKQQPQNLSALVNMGFVKMNQGLKNEAQYLFQQALQLNPDYNPARQNLKLLERL